MNQRPDRGDQPPERDEQQAMDALEEEQDFAEEHTSPTFADEQPGGPERSPEQESPEGYAGLEPDLKERRRKKF